MGKAIFDSAVLSELITDMTSTTTSSMGKMEKTKIVNVRAEMINKTVARPSG